MSKSIRKSSNPRDVARERRRVSVRKRVTGTPERPRLCVFRSNKHIYVQVIDDTQGKTLVATSTLSPEVKDKLGDLDGKGRAKLVGQDVARRCKEASIDKIVFDRGGFLYKGGRITALAEAAREGGLSF